MRTPMCVGEERPPRLGHAHPEGTRDRPGDSPATGWPIRNGANSDSVESRPRQMMKDDP